MTDDITILLDDAGRPGSSSGAQASVTRRRSANRTSPRVTAGTSTSPPRNGTPGMKQIANGGNAAAGAQMKTSKRRSRPVELIERDAQR